MKPKAKKPEPKPTPSTLGWCASCNHKRYAVEGRCLVCGAKVES